MSKEAGQNATEAGRSRQPNREKKKPKIGVGYRIGKLQVVATTSTRRQGYTVWQCRCDCGGEILLDTRFLQRSTVRDCGCGGNKVRAGQKDLTGQRFGKLVCLEPTEGRGPGGGVVWLCRCDCGNECLAVSTQLTSGYKKSCGCLSHPPLKDYIGKRFGQLQVVGYVGKRDGQHYWRCICDCGSEAVVGQTHLQSGHTKSCGCINHPAEREILEERFGALHVIGYEGKKNGQHYWRCRCGCGNETVVSQTNLLSGHTRSCGCLQRTVYRDNLKLVDGTSVTMIENSMKRTIRSNTSGYTGVYKNKKTGRWTAQITFKGKTYYLGSFDRIDDAVEARRKGEKMYEHFLEWYYQTHTNDGRVSPSDRIIGLDGF